MRLHQMARGTQHRNGRRVGVSRLWWVLLGMFAGAALIASLSTAHGADDPRTGIEAVVASPTQVPDFNPSASSSSTTVWFHGSGFTPSTELSILLRDEGGVLTDITTVTDNYPLVSNSDGAWGASWLVDRFTRVGAEGMFTVLVVDQDFNRLASVPLALCNTNSRPVGEVPPKGCAG